MKQAGGLYCPHSPSCIRGVPREPLPWNYSSNPSLVPLGAGKWLKRSGCPCGSGSAQARACPPQPPLLTPWAGSLWGLLTRASLSASSPHAPGTLSRCTDAPFQAGKGFRLPSSSPAQGRGKEEGRSSDLPGPTFPLRPRRARHVYGYCQVEAWPCSGEDSCAAGQGMGLKSFTYNHIIHWEYQGQGSPRPLPQDEGRPSCECEHQCTAGRHHSQLSFPGNHWPYDLQTQGGPAHPRVMLVPTGRRGRALGAKVTVRVGRQDLPKQQAGPWKMYNLRTPIIIIVLFFFVWENQYVHSEIIFSVNGWISFHP